MRASTANRVLIGIVIAVAVAALLAVIGGDPEAR